MALEDIIVLPTVPPKMCNYMGILVVVIAPPVTGLVTPVNCTLELYTAVGLNMSGTQTIVFKVVDAPPTTPEPLLLGNLSPYAELAEGMINRIIIGVRTRDAATYKVRSLK